MRAADIMQPPLVTLPCGCAGQRATGPDDGTIKFLVIHNNCGNHGLLNYLVTLQPEDEVDIQ
jgi:hypothetical protein